MSEEGTREDHNEHTELFHFGVGGDPHKIQATKENFTKNSNSYRQNFKGRKWIYKVKKNVDHRRKQLEDK